MEIKDIIELMKAVSDNGLTKFELEHGDTKLVMKREKEIVTVAGVNPMAGVVAANGSVMMPAVMGPVDSMVYTGSVGHGMAGAQVGTGAMMGNLAGTVTSQSEAAGAAPVSGNVITCPLVGTFYTSPSPEAECFVKVGDRVKKGQVVGIVEAMKLMNEIESDYDGVVEEILVGNEDTVEYGQPLFVIR